MSRVRVPDGAPNRQTDEPVCRRIRRSVWSNPSGRRLFYENMQCQMEMLSRLKTQLLEILNDCTRSWLDMIKQWRYNISKRECFLLKKGVSGFEENAAKDLMRTRRS